MLPWILQIISTTILHVFRLFQLIRNITHHTPGATDQDPNASESEYEDAQASLEIHTTVGPQQPVPQTAAVSNEPPHRPDSQDPNPPHRPLTNSQNFNPLFRGLVSGLLTPLFAVHDFITGLFFFLVNYAARICRILGLILATLSFCALMYALVTSFHNQPIRPQVEVTKLDLFEFSILNTELSYNASFSVSISNKNHNRALEFIKPNASLLFDMIPIGFLRLPPLSLNPKQSDTLNLNLSKTALSFPPSNYIHHNYFLLIIKSILVLHPSFDQPSNYSLSAKCKIQTTPPPNGFLLRSGCFSYVNSKYLN